MNSLKNKKILFIFGHGGMEQHCLKLSRELERKWQTQSFFSGGSKGGDDFLVKNGVKRENIHLTAFDDYKKDFTSPDVEYIKKAEEKYGFNSWDVWQISATRSKKRMKMNAEQVLFWIEYYLKGTEKSISEFKPDYLIFYGIASFAGVIIYRMAIHHKITVLEITNGRIPGRFAINNNTEGKWPLLVTEYAKLKKRDLTSTEIALAEEYIQRFKEKPFKPDGTASIKISLPEKIKKYKTYAKILAYRKQLPDMKQFLWPVANKVLDASGTFEMPVEGEKFAYFPLHVDPEVSTSFFGKWYVNQLALIETIARSLPCDCKLYVKEHPYNYSSRPLYFRNQIKRFPNVRLISPHASSVDLIKKSSLVLTITGTVGWESILLQKPVIVFGDIFYSTFDEVVKVPEIRKLPSLIKEKLDTQTDKIQTLKCVTAVFNSTFSGIGATPGDTRKAMDDENITCLVQGIEEYLLRLQQPSLEEIKQRHSSKVVVPAF